MLWLFCETLLEDFSKTLFLEDKGAEGDPNHSSNATEPLDQYTVRVGGTGLPLIYQMEPFKKKFPLVFPGGLFWKKTSCFTVTDFPLWFIRNVIKSENIELNENN